MLPGPRLEREGGKGSVDDGRFEEDGGSTNVFARGGHGTGARWAVLVGDGV